MKAEENARVSRRYMALDIHNYSVVAGVVFMIFRLNQ
jgi:hypothetical protein